MSETKHPLTDALAGSMREWITPDGPRVVMIEDAIKLTLHARTLETTAAELRARCKRIEKVTDEIQVARIKAECERDQLRARVAELEADLQAAKNRDAYRENLVTELRDERDSLRSQLAAAKADWQPIDSAPEYVDGIELNIVLVYSTDFGITTGKVCRWPDGTTSRKITGQCGDWDITHWMPLPTAPTAARAQ